MLKTSEDLTSPRNSMSQIPFLDPTSWHPQFYLQWWTDSFRYECYRKCGLFIKNDVDGNLTLNYFFTQAHPKCTIVNLVFKSKNGLSMLEQVGSGNVIFHLDILTMKETDIKALASKAKRDLLCSVVIADGGKIQNYSDSYTKIKVPLTLSSFLSSRILSKLANH